jgi:glutathione S-transferase
MTDTADLTLYYSPKACSLASHIALEEADLVYKTRPINVRTGENRTEDYLKINPLGSVPALGIGDAVLTESQAILTYVADLVPDKKLIPAAGDLGRARAHEMMNFLAASVHPTYTMLFRTPRFAGEEDAAQQAVSELAHERLAARLTTVDQRLPDSGFALGENFTVADAYLFVFYLWSADDRLDQSKVPERPRYRAHAERVWQRPAVQAVIAREREVRRYDLPDHFPDA